VRLIRDLLKENRAHNLNQKGRNLFRKGRYQEAIQAFDESLALYEEMDPEVTRKARAMVLDNKGRAWAKLGQYRKAMEAHTRAIALVPNFLLPWNNKGLLLLSQKRYDEALRCFEEAIRINPKADPILWINRGEVLEKLGRFQEAARSFDEAIGLNSGAARAWFGLARCAWAEKDSDFALKCLEKTIKLDRTNYKARLLEAEIRIALDPKR